MRTLYLATPCPLPSALSTRAPPEPPPRLTTTNSTFVDGNLLADIKERILPALACGAEALFILLGELNESIHKSPLSMDKHHESLCSCSRKQLGILINTRSLTAGITPEKRKELLDLLSSTWHPKRKSFTLREGASLLGATQSLALTTTWGKHLCIEMQHSVFLALHVSTKKVFANSSFSEFVSLICNHSTSLTKFHISSVFKKIWNSKETFFISSSMRRHVYLMHFINCNYVNACVF